ncbi:DUF4911 domain-containing protein [Carboxydothermus pertinax]|uniref:DUF4911 domain-containing protein n=1 Tax=Carboxydothermus pertinax TaxID=870242 RepID=A0A1L8CUA6_9THEO|nr:DUF4911 domain-containing protein [Carboxydothermus pertinax]GAV22429.1 DUF4911 domain-containing protein [Carboxydothermus pertinax]
MNKQETVLVEVNPREIVFLDFLLEGFNGLGIGHTVDPKKARVAIYTTETMREELIATLKNLPLEIKIIDW